MLHCAQGQSSVRRVYWFLLASKDQSLLQPSEDLLVSLDTIIKNTDITIPKFLMSHISGIEIQFIQKRKCRHACLLQINCLW